jgi:hypothetical protein
VNFRHDLVRFYTEEGGDTPLHFAARTRIGHQGSWDNKLPSDVPANCMKILLSYGANVDSQNDVGRTPLHAAVASSDLLCVRVLVKHGARTDLKDKDGKTALMLAQNMDVKNEEMIDFLAGHQG